MTDPIFISLKVLSCPGTAKDLSYVLFHKPDRDRQKNPTCKHTPYLRYKNQSKLVPETS